MGPQFTRLLETAYAKKNGWTDVSHFVVRFDHPACSYGDPVLVERNRGNTAYGPSDVGPVQYAGQHRDALANAGFTLIEEV